MADSPLRFLPAGNSTVTTVGSVNTAGGVLLLASNPNRLGAIIANNSNSRLFIKYGATAETDDFTVRLSPQKTHVVRGGYTGRIDGIWAPNVSGSAEVTETTP